MQKVHNGQNIKIFNKDGITEFPPPLALMWCSDNVVAGPIFV